MFVESKRLRKHARFPYQPVLPPEDRAQGTTLFQAHEYANNSRVQSWVYESEELDAML